MLDLLQSASSLRSLLFDTFPIKSINLPAALFWAASPASNTTKQLPHNKNNTASTRSTSINSFNYYYYGYDDEDDDFLQDLAFDAYEYDIIDEKKQQHFETTTTTLINYSAFDSYDWAFSFRESAKSDDKLILEVSLERIPKECETHCLPSPSTTEMTLLHGDHYASGSPVAETSDLISEEEQNMILAAIIASRENDFERQIPGYARDELEHAAMIAAMEESKELAERKSASPSPKPVASVSTPTREAPTPSAFTASSPTTPRTPRGLTRTDSDIPWRSSKGEYVEGESEAQQRFREMLQFHAVAAASVANAAARTGASNITGNIEDEDDYGWIKKN